jgi:acetyltransferase-like isoleucine patch superfamily enzyme
VSASVEPSAVVESGARIGDGTHVWDLSQVRAGASIGDECVIGRNVYVDADVVIGNRCKIQNNALVYGPARLGDGVFVGPAAVLTNDLHPRAVTPDGALKGADAWHAAGVVIEQGAAVGAGAVVISGVSIGAWALVAANATVTRSVPAHALVAGSPARQVAWVGRTGRRLEPVGGQRFTCPDTDATYIEHDGVLTED